MEKQAYLSKKFDRANFADTNAMYAKLVEVLCATLKNEGTTSTVALINALVSPMPNLVITLTTAGTLTRGTDLAVVVGDKVYFDGTSWNRISIDTKQVIEVITANRTLTAADSGKIFLVGTDALTISLPATAVGLDYTFINIGAAGNNIITISPVAADGISGTITLAASVVVLDGTVDKDLINTKATSKTGDSVQLIGTGVTGTGAWAAIRSSGIWARQA